MKKGILSISDTWCSGKLPSLNICYSLYGQINSLPPTSARNIPTKILKNFCGSLTRNRFAAYAPRKETGIAATSEISGVV